MDQRLANNSSAIKRIRQLRSDRRTIRSLSFLFIFILVPWEALADQPDNAASSVKPANLQYKLVMSKDDKVCKYTLNRYNEKLMKYGYEKYDEHEEGFGAIKWQEIKVYRIENGKKAYSHMKAARFDINNDGKSDFVVRDESSFGGYEADLLFILSDQRSDFSKEFAIGELRDSPSKIYMAPWGYNLQKTTDSQLKIIGNIRILKPFVFNDTTYISMHPLFNLESKNIRKILIITKYKKGRLVPREDQTGVTEDVCYLERVGIAKE